jgi:hypothetical protein
VNEDQKLIFGIGLVLLLVTIFTTYRSYLEAIFLNGSGSTDTVSPSTPANQAPPNSSRIENSGPGGAPVNLGPGSGQSTIPSVGGGPPAPTF